MSIYIATLLERCCLSQQEMVPHDCIWYFLHLFPVGLFLTATPSSKCNFTHVTKLVCSSLNLGSCFSFSISLGWEYGSRQPQRPILTTSANSWADCAGFQIDSSSTSCSFNSLCSLVCFISKGPGSCGCGLRDGENQAHHILLPFGQLFS